MNDSRETSPLVCNPYPCPSGRWMAGEYRAGRQISDTPDALRAAAFELATVERASRRVLEKMALELWQTSPERFQQILLRISQP